MSSRFFTFAGGETGLWRVAGCSTIRGDGLPAVHRLEICNGLIHTPVPSARWMLRGVTSNDRYVTRPEKTSLAAVQPELGRSEATRAALIPIRKSAAWWQMTQEERREVLETRSSHIATGLRYLPAVARRLHHSRDLGEPFDFLTWFEFAPEHEAGFDELVAALRATEEWRYVDREVDLRLSREPAGFR